MAKRFLSAILALSLVLALGLFMVIYVYFSLTYDGGVTINVG